MMPALPASGVYLRTVMIRYVRGQDLQISCLKRAAVFLAFLPHATALDHRIFPPANSTCVILVTRDVAILTGGCQRFDISLSRSNP
jgi:hypothetical protein